MNMYLELCKFLVFLRTHPSSASPHCKHRVHLICPSDVLYQAISVKWKNAYVA